jgi:hypothetical protein
VAIDTERHASVAIDTERHASVTLWMVLSR